MPDIDSYPTATAIAGSDRVILRQTDGDGSVHTRRGTISQLQAGPTMIQNGLTAVVGGQGVAVVLTGVLCVFTTVPPSGGGVLTAPVGVTQRIYNRCGSGQVVEIFPPNDMAIERGSVNAPVNVADGGATDFTNNGTVILVS